MKESKKDRQILVYRTRDSQKSHFQTFPSLCPLQSAKYKFHSTETSGGFSNSAPTGQVYFCRPGGQFTCVVVSNNLFMLFHSQLSNSLTPLSWTEESDNLFWLFRLHSVVFWIPFR